MNNKRNIYTIRDLDGKNIVIINDVIFKNRKFIKWNDVENYLIKYIGDFYQVAETNDVIFIGKDLPKEYVYSKYSYSLNKPYKKVKANIVQAIPEIIINATNRKYRKNYKDKHVFSAGLGWYKYDIKFGLPVFDNYGSISKYSIYDAALIVRKSSDGLLYLYDIVQKKETS